MSTIYAVYTYVFGRRMFWNLNRFLIGLGLRGIGYLNYESHFRTGERMFQRYIAKSGIHAFLDIGANRGEYCSQLLELIPGVCFAFEPVQDTYIHLQRLEEKYRGRLKTFNIAVGDTPKSGQISYGDTGRFATLVEEANEIDYVAKVNTKLQEVNIESLDNLLSKGVFEGVDSIDFVKIDTEGYEYEVIKGASNFLKVKSTKYVQIEFNTHHLLRGHTFYMLSGLLGDFIPYRILSFNNGIKKIDPKSMENNIFAYSNVVFIRKDVAMLGMY